MKIILGEPMMVAAPKLSNKKEQICSFLFAPLCCRCYSVWVKFIFYN
ncbi:hypothetical protein [Clostridium beijerinckii]|nr:hypothetical protein [Clostridium beijerinckii]